MIEIENPGDRYVVIRNPRKKSDVRCLATVTVDGSRRLSRWPRLQERKGPPPSHSRWDDKARDYVTIKGEKERCEEAARLAAMTRPEFAEHLRQESERQLEPLRAELAALRARLA